jgi:Domain of unknown function (DUF4124)
VTGIKGFGLPNRHTGGDRRMQHAANEDAVMDAIGNRSEPRNERRASAVLALGIVAGVLGAWLALPAGAAVYKWTDPQGNVHYSDEPPPPEGTLISADARNERPRTDTARPAEPAAPAAPPGKTDPAQLKKTVDADVANAHAGECKQAEERYQTYVRSRRLYKEGPNKERIYLTDAELDAERLSAKRDVDEICKGSEQH